MLKVLQASEQDIRVNHSYQVIHNANPVLNKTEMVDLRAQQQRLGERIPKAIQKILDHGQYIMVRKFESLRKSFPISPAPDTLSLAPAARMRCSWL